MPRVDAPAAKHTACASAMPTSKYRCGNFLANFASPVPSGIAAVIPTTRSSRSAAEMSASANACANVGRDAAFSSRPSSGWYTPGPTPWNVRLSPSAIS